MPVGSMIMVMGATSLIAGNGLMEIMMESLNAIILIKMDSV